MSLSASEIFDTIASVYATDPDKSKYLEMAALQTSVCNYGTSYNLAIALRAAHAITVNKSGDFPGGSGGGVVSKKEGDLSISYGNITGKGSVDWLSLTPYGKQLIGLSKGKTLTMGVTGSAAANLFGCW